MNSKKLDSKQMQLYSSFCSVLLGIGLNAFLPGMTLYAFLFNLFGIGGIIFYFSTRSKYDRVFRNLKLGFETAYPILKNKVNNEYSNTYKFTLPTGLSVEDIKKKQEAIEQYVGKKINIEYINKGLFIIEEYHQNTIQKFNYEPTELTGNIPILIGKGRNGKLECFDLAEGTEPHLLIAGSTGCGKSNALLVIIANLILFTAVNLHLIDLKHGASFNVFKRSSHVKSFAETLEKAEEVLNSLYDEIEARYQKMARNGCGDVKNYNKRHKNNPLPYELLVIDEMVDFIQRQDLLEQLSIISAKARACGIHMILSTQRPDKDILNGKVKCNVTNVLGMKTMDATNSRIIIDTDGLEKLAGKGHAILSRLGEMIEVQTPYITVDKVKELIKHTYVSKTEPKAIPAEKIEIDITDLEVFQ